MAENFKEFNIFGKAPASFQTALPQLAAAGSFVLPVTGESEGDVQFQTLLPRTEGGRAVLQAFTDEAALTTAFIKYQPLETALIFFHAQKQDAFSFDPGLGKSSSVTATRAEISLLAGRLQAGGAAAADPLQAAAAEFSLGNLHKAHFLYSLEAQKGPFSPARLPMYGVLAELGLYQAVYDALKTERSPEALLLLAVIYRRTGHPQRAAEALEAAGMAGPLEERKSLETAWLYFATDRNEEAEKEFERLAATAVNKAEALSGLGAARAKRAFSTPDFGLLAKAVASLESALKAPSPGAARIYFQLGNVYFRSGNLVKAENCYRQAAAQSPSVQALANLTATLIRAGKYPEAEALTSRIALTDPAAAKQLIAKLRAEKSPPPSGSRDQEAPPDEEPKEAYPAPEFEIESFPVAPPAARTALPSAMPGQASLEPASPRTSTRTFSPGLANPEPPQHGPAAIPLAMPGLASLEPAATNVPQAFPSWQGGAQKLSVETMQDVMRSVPDFSTPDRRPEDFMSGAFRLASALERETGGKVHFNREGLEALERKLRSSARDGKSEAGIALAKDCAAFLCYFLQERHKGRLVKMPDFEPWAWPMLFENNGRKLTTYPAQRAWRLIGEGEFPEPGWLVKYSDWLIARLQETAPLPSGAAAVKNKIASNPERLIDTATEHKRMMLLAANLAEISGIEQGRPGLFKLGTTLKNNFKPNIPPSADGWRLLRCCGHIMAEILTKDFKAAWYNTDGEDGAWSMRLPWGTFVFPLGKTYKAAAAGEDLGDYYGVLLLEKKSRE